MQTVKPWRWGIKEAFSPVSHSGFCPEAKDALMLNNLPLECAWIEQSVLIDASEESPNQTWDSWDRCAPESDSALNTLWAESGAVRERMEQHWPQFTDDQFSAIVKLSKIIDTRYWTDPNTCFLSVLDFHWIFMCRYDLNNFSRKWYRLTGQMFGNWNIHRNNYISLLHRYSFSA